MSGVLYVLVYKSTLMKSSGSWPGLKAPAYQWSAALSWAWQRKLAQSVAKFTQPLTRFFQVSLPLHFIVSCLWFFLACCEEVQDWQWSTCHWHNPWKDKPSLFVSWLFLTNFCLIRSSMMFQSTWWPCPQVHPFAHHHGVLHSQSR